MSNNLSVNNNFNLVCKSHDFRYLEVQHKNYMNYFSNIFLFSTDSNEDLEQNEGNNDGE